ncbi:MAG: hypothetical protein PHZ19_05755 [Candidatus Thermoplasmatota archaeon]|nr:hypothetical protein [Candidatus Thermoplasmatota archaeon]
MGSDMLDRMCRDTGTQAGARSDRNKRPRRKFPVSTPAVGRAITSLPGIAVRSDIPSGTRPILLVVRASRLVRDDNDLVYDASEEDRQWAKETGKALMESGRPTWVVEVRDHELLPDDSQVLAETLHARALLWPEWMLAYGPGIMAAEELARIFVDFCRARGRWGDPCVMDALRGCDDLYSILQGLPEGTFVKMFFTIREEVMT